MLRVDRARQLGKVLHLGEGKLNIQNIYCLSAISKHGNDRRRKSARNMEKIPLSYICQMYTNVHVMPGGPQTFYIPWKPLRFLKLSSVWPAHGSIHHRQCVHLGDAPLEKKLKNRGFNNFGPKSIWVRRIDT